VLPNHYRTSLLYYRRPPRVPQLAVTDSHLLLMRELACAPATFDALQERCALDSRQLARDLAALYFVGSITSNPRRAGLKPKPRRKGRSEAAQGLHSSMPSALDSVFPEEAMRKSPVFRDLTVPAALAPR
jgi:hypothetical protein